MANRYDDEKFGDVVRDYVRGNISRRQFIVRGAQLGLSAAVLAKLTQPSRAAANLIDSDPASPYESPITPERVAFLKTKPYKGTTINVMVLKATVGDGAEISRAALGGGDRRQGERRRGADRDAASRRSSPISPAGSAGTTPT